MSRQEFAQEFARRINALTPEQIAALLETAKPAKDTGCPTT
jgi:predicted Zn-dependent peptidase